jgi:glutamate dehydrogenase/leucine dehydrogenase
LERAGSKTDIPKDIFQYIESCQAVVRFNIPLKMDDGSVKTVTCYRA